MKRLLWLFLLVAAPAWGQTHPRLRFVTIPCVGTPVAVGDSLQTVVTAGAPGDTFCLATGVHRLQSAALENGMVFIGTGPGAVLSGAKLLTSPSGTGPWTYASQTQAGTEQGTCRATEPRCQHPEDLFVNDVALHHAANVGEVTSSSNNWFFDKAADIIYLGTDPAGKVVETSVTAAAFTATGGTVTGARIANLTIEKYATPGNTGAVQAPNTDGLVVERVVARLNHAAGLVVGTHAVIRNSYLHHNGQSGAGGYDLDDLSVLSNESSYNGRWFEPLYDGGGFKFAYVRSSVFAGNFVHHNYGYGWWCDVDCTDVVLEDNDLEDNDQAGAFYEISFSGIIRNNRILRNGFNAGDGPAQAGLYIANSNVVDVYENTISGNAWGAIAWMDARGTSPAYAVDWELENVTFHNNTICVATGNAEAALVVNGFVDDTFYTSRGNSFSLNTYKGLSTGNFYWLNATRTFAVWQGTYTQDAAGSRTVGASCP